MSIAAVTLPGRLVRFFEPWAHAYGDSKVLPTIVVFSHIAALVFAGGLAVALDRATLRAVRSPALRDRQLDELGAAHRLVLGGLAISLVSGLFLFTSDIETFFASRIFWTKMALLVLLLVNGFLMTRHEARLRATPAIADATWRRLRRSALASLVLWFAIAFAGVALVNAG